MILQVLTLMPLRTIMNYQYRYGTNFTNATKTLFTDGGWVRYYQGLTAALVQGPISRFGDTAANAGILALLNSNEYTRTLPELEKTVFVSLAAACFRILLTPIDTIKTTLQTQGKPGIAILKNRVGRFDSTVVSIEPDSLVDQEVWYRNNVVWCHGHCCCHVRGQLSSMLNIKTCFRYLNDMVVAVVWHI